MIGLKAQTTMSDVPASDVQSENTYRNIKAPIVIRRSDRVLIVGKTGSGKSMIAGTLLRLVPYLVVLDPKHQFELWTNAEKPPYPLQQILVTDRLTTAKQHDTPYPIIYRPDEIEARKGCAEFWRWIWTRKNTLVYVDEVTAVSPTTNMPYGYARAVQMGRGWDIGVWSCTQRPARIPQNLISESEHILAAELRNPADLHRVAEFTDPIIERRPVRNHDFWYYNVRENQPRIINAKDIRIG